MMNLFDLATEVAQVIEERYERKVNVQRVQKNNGIELIGLTVMGDSNVSPNVYIESLVEDYGENVDAIAEKVMEISMKHNMPSINIEWITDFEQVKPKIFAVLVNTKANEERFDTVVHTNLLDLSVVYKIKIDTFDVGDGISTVTITNQLMENWGVTVDDINKVATENTPKMFPYVYEDMKKILMEMMGIEDEDDLPTIPGAPMMNILSNTEKLNGATCIFYPNCLKEISNGKKLIVIPSSIHECIILDYESTNLGDMNMIINDINETQVRPDEVLSDHYYIYDPETDELEYED